ncbi:MAG TPA: hypothetical protein VL916_02230, partial [Ilumatobacteraceae bacterium]|nr:hypothetical protein [Ilumatobacteraceae bacterium]
MNGDDWLIGRYEVLRTISSGPRATVLQALDHVHDKLVALKVYPLAGADRDAILAEAQVLYDIEPHPALPVARGDFFTADGHYFGLAMKWIEGSDLQRVLDD